MVYLYFRTEKVEIHKIEYTNILKMNYLKHFLFKRGGES